MKMKTHHVHFMIEKNLFEKLRAKLEMQGYGNLTEFFREVARRAVNDGDDEDAV